MELLITFGILFVCAVALGVAFGIKVERDDWRKASGYAVQAPQEVADTAPAWKACPPGYQRITIATTAEGIEVLRSKPFYEWLRSELKSKCGAKPTPASQE